jgi:tryptophanyl-tRNA synthetase
MSIETDSTPLEAPKDTETCNVFALYKILASANETATMKQNYEAGNYGYGHAKQALYELIITKFATEREKYNYYINHLDQVENALQLGAQKAHLVANEVLQRVRTKLGFS